MVLALGEVSVHLYQEAFRARWGASVSNIAAKWGQCWVYMYHSASILLGTAGAASAHHWLVIRNVPNPLNIVWLLLLLRFNHNPPRQTLELGEERSTSPHGGDTQLVSKVRATKYLLVRNPSVSTCIKTDIKTPSPRDGCSRKASLPTPHSHLLPRDHRSSSHRASCTGVCCSMGL
jgi:hypothetical protein